MNRFRLVVVKRFLQYYDFPMYEETGVTIEAESIPLTVVQRSHVRPRSDYLNITVNPELEGKNKSGSFSTLEDFLENNIKSY